MVSVCLSPVAQVLGNYQDSYSLAEKSVESDAEKSSDDQSDSKQVSQILQIDKLTADNQLEIGDVDDVYTVNSNTKKITGVISIVNPNKRDWYFKAEDGTENALSDLSLQGAFQKGRVSKVEVDQKNPASLSFEIESLQDNNEHFDFMSLSSGIICIPAQYNCYNMNLVVEIHIDDLCVDPEKSAIVADDPSDENSSYTISISFLGGKLKENIKKEKIAFDGVFQDAIINGEPKTDHDMKGFSVNITKSKSTSFAQRNGNIILDENTLIYDNGQPFDAKMTFYLADPMPTDNSEETNAEDQKVVQNGVYDKIAAEKLIHAPDPKAILELFASLKAIPGLEFFGTGSEILGKFLEVLGAFKNPVEKALNEIIRQLEAINARLQKLEAQLDQATIEIVGQIDKQTLISRIELLQKEINGLSNKYGSYDAPALFALQELNPEKIEVDSDTIKTQESALLTVYNTDLMTVQEPAKANDAYLSDFLAVCDDISNANAIVTGRNTFDNYKAYCTYGYNWNTQTFDQRDAYNKYVYSVFSKDYTIIYSAVFYDYEKNKNKLEKLQSEIAVIDDLLTKNADAVSKNGESLSQIRKAYNEELENVKLRRNKSAYHLNIAIPGEQEPAPNCSNLVWLQKTIKENYNSAQTVLRDERAAYDKGRIRSYRLNKDVNRDLGTLVVRDVVDPTYYWSDPAGSGGPTVKISEAEAQTKKINLDVDLKVSKYPSYPREVDEALANFSHKRGIMLYDDLASALFQIHWKYDNDFLKNKSKDTYLGLYVAGEAKATHRLWGWYKNEGYGTYLAFDNDTIKIKQGYKFWYYTFYKPRYSYVTDKYFLYLRDP